MNTNDIINYIISSVANIIEASHTPIFMEGEINDPFKDIEELVNYELRFVDFRFTTYTKNEYSVTFDIDILIKAKIQRDEPYKINSYIGEVVTTLSSNIPIKRYGDDNTIIDCLKLIEPILAEPLGQVKPNINVIFGQVVGKYKLEWSE